MLHLLAQHSEVTAIRLVLSYSLSQIMFPPKYVDLVSVPRNWLPINLIGYPWRDSLDNDLMVAPSGTVFAAVFYFYPFK